MLSMAFHSAQTLHLTVPDKACPDHFQVATNVQQLTFFPLFVSQFQGFFGFVDENRYCIERASPYP
ncbi:MAG TPA: hypothetical protein DCF63_18160 [Planctomycetaceae bacterium]|nr:hypothetical protein [Planctomycetaceae bacterium]